MPLPQRCHKRWPSRDRKGAFQTPNPRKRSIRGGSGYARSLTVAARGVNLP